jgi:hypothetical protein
MVHAGGRWALGGDLLLLFLIGVSFAEYQSEALFKGAVWGTILKYILVILVPYYIATVLDLIRLGIYIDRVFLYTNFTPTNHLYSGIFPYWFVQVLVQILIALGVFFSFSRVRTFVKTNPWRASFIILLVLVVLRVLYPLLWDTTYVNHAVPNRMVVFCWLGWTAYFSRQKIELILVGALSVVFVYYDMQLARTVESVTPWVLLGCIIFLLFRQVILPRYLTNLLEVIASATFFIFILNSLTIHIMKYKIGVLNPEILFFTGILSGVVVWALFDRLYIIDRIFNLWKAFIREKGDT